MTSPERVYIDTEIFVYYFITREKPEFSAMAKRFLKKVEDGKYEGVVSLLTLMELTKTIRRLCVELMLEYDARIWKQRMAEAYDTISKIKNVKIIEGNPTERVGISFMKDVFYSEIAREAHDTIEKFIGKVYQNEKGRILHSGINCVDSLHIILAKRTGCDRIATFDNGFTETKSEIIPLMLQKDLW